MSTEPAIWLDGAPASALPLPDRAMEFGDGLFETMLLKSGRPLYADLHWQRLEAGLRVLRFPACLDFARDCLQRALAELSAGAWSALRLTVSRGGGPRGYAPPESTVPRVVISAVGISRDCRIMQSPASLCMARWHWSTQPALAGIKHLNRLEQVMAAADAREAGTDEALLLDQAGSVISVAAGNLFLVRDGVLVTPSLEACGILGTRRRLVLERWAAPLELRVEESSVTLKQLAAAEEVFFCNSLTGLRPVGSLGESRWRSHPVCEALHEQYLGDIA